jgi:multiple sugar transport system substrate-binding protein
MARNKGLLSPAKDLSFDSMYAAFGAVPESRIVSPEEFGLTDDAVIQLRQAGFLVGTGAMTVDEAVAGFGTFTK